MMSSPSALSSVPSEGHARKSKERHPHESSRKKKGRMREVQKRSLGEKKKKENSAGK
jgi:hypothetical protein